MALHHADFFDAIVECLPFETNAGRLNLPNYLERQPARPGEKVPIYFFSYGGDSNQFYDLCRAKGLTVINTGYRFDEEVLRKYAERHAQKIELRRMDTLDDPNIYQHLSVDERHQFLPLEDSLVQALRLAWIPTRSPLPNRSGPGATPARRTSRPTAWA
jgi:HSP90 family molecular chaperone